MKRFVLFSTLAMLLSVANIISINRPLAARAQTTCPDLPAMTLTAQLPIDGTYALWLRGATGSSSPTAIYIKFDNETTCSQFKLPTDSSFLWVSGINGKLTKELDAGTHEVSLLVDGGEIKADKLLLTGNTGCTPNGDGQNCTEQAVNVQVTGLQANQSVDNQMQVTTTLSGAELVNPKVEYYFDAETTPFVSRTQAPYCLFIKDGACTLGDVSSLSAGSHSLRVVVSAENMESYTQRIPFTAGRTSTTTPVTSNPTPTPTPTPTPSPSPSPSPSPAPVTQKPTTTVSPAKNNTIVVGTSTNTQPKTSSGQQAVTVSPSQPLKSGDTVTYSVNNKTVGTTAVTDENSDPSLTVDLSNERDGESTVSATVNRTDGSSETYGSKTKIDNSTATATKSWFQSTGIRLIFSTIALVLLVVGGVLIYRAIKRRREYALYHNISDYQYVQPQSDVGAYALPPLALVFFGIGAIFSSLGGAESARVGVVLQLAQEATLPASYALVTESNSAYVLLRAATSEVPDDEDPDTPPPDDEEEPSQPTPTGQFYVVGKDIVDPDGNLFVPFGGNVAMSIAKSNGTLTDPGVFDFGGTANGKSDAALTWGWNIIRPNLVCNVPAIGTPRELADSVTVLVNEYTPKKIVVMPECHDITGASPTYTGGNGTMNAAKEFWSYVIQEHKDNPYVWLNFFNEPGGDANYVQGLNDHFTALRDSFDAENIVVMDLPGFAQDINWFLSSSYPPANSARICNAVYSWHNYGGGRGSVGAQDGYFNGIVNSSLPLFIGEYGYRADGKDFIPGNSFLPTNAELQQVSRKVLDAYKQKRIGSLVWNGTGDSAEFIYFSLGAEYQNPARVSFASLADGAGLSAFGQDVWNAGKNPPAKISFTGSINASNCASAQ